MLLWINVAAHATTNDSVFTYSSKINGELVPMQHTKELVHQYNPTAQLGKYYAHRGNYGLPIQALVYTAPTNLLTTIAPTAMGAYLYTTANATYYDTKRPYTDIHWINGLKKEQYVRVIHTQNITPRWNVAIDFTRYRNKGYFLRHLANNAHFGASTVFRNKRSNYVLNGAYALNRLSMQENGGVNDTVFLTIGFVAKTSLTPLLAAASRIYKSNSFMLNQRFYPFYKADTSNKLTTVLPPHGLFINMVNKYTIARNNYIDAAPNPSFYSETNYNTVFTNDSNSVREQNNYVSLGYASAQSNDTLNNWQYSTSAGLGTQQGRINYFERIGVANTLLAVQRTTFNNTYTQWQAHANNAKLALGYNGQYVLTGYNANNVLNNVEAAYNLTHTHLLTAGVNNSVRRGDYFTNNYYSNNFKWDTNFVATQSTQINVGYTNSRYRFSVQAFSNTLHHHVYFDSLAKATQSTSTIVNNGIVVQWHARYKKLNWQANVTLQTNTTPTQLIAPHLLTRQLVYLQGKLFKNALPLQVGIDASYTNTYKGYGYMPATMLYYVSGTSINAYPFADFFVNASIGQARIFFKVEHFLSGVLGNNYFTTKNSPAADRNIKLGVYWYMYN